MLASLGIGGGGGKPLEGFSKRPSGPGVAKLKPRAIFLRGSPQEAPGVVGEQDLARLPRPHGGHAQEDHSDASGTLHQAGLRRELLGTDSVLGVGPAASVLSSVRLPENVVEDGLPMMGSEDFSCMLLQKPGCYLFIGNGEEAPECHNPHYDFNDDILPLGATYWVNLVDDVLGPE